MGPQVHVERPLVVVRGLFANGLQLERLLLPVRYRVPRQTASTLYQRTQSWLRVYIYVDNLGGFAPTAEAARAALDANIADFSELGLIIHETEVNADTAKARHTR